ncbi:hypothetical protein [Microbacterium halotolerans]|uniref:hypothetical protein n=1 Tax=Microbacterium halotolerans TaxID=246613 RepID=UPI0013C311F5|nr:hypothetical protein [Microbacterium halotolerans]
MHVLSQRSGTGEPCLCGYLIDAQVRALQEFARAGEALAEMKRLQELSGGNVSFVGPPTILLAGDAVVALLIHERHARPGKPELIVPRLYVYEIAEGKFTKSFGWQLESDAFDQYYPRPA